MPPMLVLRRAFVSARTGRLRAAWRLLLFAGAFAAAVVAMRGARWLLTGAGRPPPSASLVSEPYFLLSRLTGVIAVAGVTAAMLRWVDRRSWRDLGLPWSRAAQRDLVKGFGLGSSIMAAGFAALWVTGAIHVLGISFDPPTMRLLVFQVVPATFLVGLYEELLFRGYPFQVACEGMGRAGATIAVSLLFGLVHLSNPNITLFTAGATSLWSVFISVLLLRTRSLWACVGLHFAGNLVQGFVFGSPMSGVAFTRTFLQVEWAGAPWLVGGASGLEAALPTLLATVAATAWVGWGRSWAPRREARLSIALGVSPASPLEPTAPGPPRARRPEHRR